MRIDFTKGVLPSNVTLTRASSATQLMSGVVTDIALNVPRFQDGGLLVEDERNNTVVSNQGAGAVVGTIGNGGALPTEWTGPVIPGVSIDVVRQGTVNGVPFTDLRFYGTPQSATAGYVLFLEASGAGVITGDTWTSSVWLGLQAGALVGSHAIRMNAAATDKVVAINSTLSRLFNTAPIPASNGRLSLVIRMGVTTPMDYTVRIGLPQREKGTEVTSVIKTTGSTGNRKADLVTVTDPTIVSKVLRYVYTDNSFRDVKQTVGSGGVFTVPDAAKSGVPLKYILDEPLTTSGRTVIVT